MTKLLGIALVVVGAFLIVWGYNESQTVGSHLNRMFSGAETERTLLYYIGGGVCLVAGILALVRK